MPFHLNDDALPKLTDKFDRTETPVPPPVEHAESNTSQPVGPGNRVNFDFAKVGPGDPKYLTGPPLSELNAIPYRGAGMAGHGLDTDLTQNDWLNHPDVSDATAGGEDEYQYYNAPEPIVVKVVEMPLETEEKYSRIIAAFSATEPYVFTTVGQLDLSQGARTILPKDDTRVRATIYATASPAQIAGTGTAQYAFLISNDQQCTSGIILGAGGNSTNSIILLGKSPVFARLVPLAAYDSTKTNNYQLSIIAETTNLGQKRVM